MMAAIYEDRQSEWYSRTASHWYLASGTLMAAARAGAAKLNVDCVSVLTLALVSDPAWTLNSTKTAAQHLQLSGLIAIR